MNSKEAARLLQEMVLPEHIGIIMDGNGRWAKKRGMPRTMGHRQGAKTFQKVVRFCSELGLRYATFYAFSTENWKRPKEEVDAIMDLLREYLQEAARHSEEDRDLCFSILGDITPLSADLQESICTLEERTRGRTGLHVNIALNYGGRDEIVHAVRLLAEQVKCGTLLPEAIDSAMLERYLYTAGQPDPDLIIRPSGEQRSSNFLLWQSAYAEYLYMDVLWPDFSEDDLVEALLQYGRRHRRFGGI